MTAYVEIFPWLILKAPFLCGIAVALVEGYSHFVLRRSFVVEQRELAYLTLFLCWVFAFFLDGGMARLMPIPILVVGAVRFFSSSPRTDHD